MDFLTFRRFDGGNLSTPILDRRNPKVNDENQPNLVTPQRMVLDLHHVTPSPHGKSALLSGAKRILPNANKAVESKVPATAVGAVKHEKNRYMKPTEAFQNAIEDPSSTPLRAKKSSFSLRTPVQANTPNTLHKTFKKSKPSVTPATPATPGAAAPSAVEHSAHKERKVHHEHDGNIALQSNHHLHTPVRQKSPARKQRSESTPPARPQSRSGRRDASSVVSGKSVPSYMEPTVTHSAKKVVKEQKEEVLINTHAETILYSPQSLLRRSNSASRLDALLSSEKSLERPVLAPKPRPSPFTFALHNEETKENAKMELLRSPAPTRNVVHTVVTPDVEQADLPPPPPSAQKSVKSAKKPAQAGGFTAEQLSAYKARKRAILAVGTANAGGNKSHSAARYAAPTVSAFIRAKEVQVSKKPAVVTPPPAPAAGGSRLKTPSSESMPMRFASPNRRTEATNAATDNTVNVSAKKSHGDRFASPSLIRERMVKEQHQNNHSIRNREEMEGMKVKKIDPVKLLELVDAVEQSVIHESTHNSPSKYYPSNNHKPVKKELDISSASSLKMDHHGMSTLTPSHDSKATNFNSDALFESYNESSNILNMSIDESENNNLIRHLQQQRLQEEEEERSRQLQIQQQQQRQQQLQQQKQQERQKIEMKAQRSFEGDISSVLPSGGAGASIVGKDQHELLDEVSFQESMDYSSNTFKQLLAPAKPVDLLATSMEQTSDIKESNSMNNIIEESKKLMEENKRVIQTVQERMMKFDLPSQVSSNHSNQPGSNVESNLNATGKMNLDVMNLSAIEPTSTSPHSFSIGSISTFGEMSAHRRTFSPIQELLRKPSIGNAPLLPSMPPATSTGLTINTAPLPPSMSRKRSMSTELPTPRLPADLLNLSVISRSNSVHCLPTPTSFGGNFSRSETPLMMFENSTGKITPQPVVPLVRSTSLGQNLTEVNNAWANEYLTMLQQSTKAVANTAPVVQFPSDQKMRASKEHASDGRKFSITDSEVEYINTHQTATLASASSGMDESGNDSSNPLNIAMIRSGNSSLGIFSTSQGPSALTIPIITDESEPFTPLIMPSPLPTPSMNLSSVPPVIMIPTVSATNPISMMDVNMSPAMLIENKENMSPLGVMVGVHGSASGSRSPFFPSASMARTPLQTIKEEEKAFISVATNSSSVEEEGEEERENSENQPPSSTSQQNLSDALMTSQGVSSNEVTVENTNSSSTGHATSLNEGFLKDSLINMSSANPSNTSAASNHSSEMMMTSTSIAQVAGNNNETIGEGEKDTRSRLFSQNVTSLDMAISPNKANDDCEEVVLPKQMNSSFELEPRKLSVIPTMIPTSTHHTIVPHTHHVKALDYESIEKTPLIGRSTSLSSGRVSAQRSIGSSVTRSATRRSPGLETDMSLPMSMTLPTILPSVPIPPLHNNYLNEVEEEEQQQMNDRRLADRIEMSDDVVNVEDNDYEQEDEEEEEVGEGEEEEEGEVEYEAVDDAEAMAMVTSSLPYSNDSSMIEMNGSLHSFDANVILSMSNRSMELIPPLPSPTPPIVTNQHHQSKHQHKQSAMVSTITSSNPLNDKSDQSNDEAVIGGDVISELIKGICEVESSLTRAEQSPSASTDTMKKSTLTASPLRRINSNSKMTMKSAGLKQLTPTNSDYSLNATMSNPPAPVSISSHPNHHHHHFHYPQTFKPAAELSAMSADGMIDRSGSSYTSSVDELAGYNTLPVPSLTVEAGGVAGIPTRLTSHLFAEEKLLPSTINRTRDAQGTMTTSSFQPDDDADADEMDIESVRLVAHREEMNPALAPSPRTKPLKNIISPDPVASQLMLNNRRHINDRNIKMMEQTFMTVNDLNNSR